MKPALNPMTDSSEQDIISVKIAYKNESLMHDKFPFNEQAVSPLTREAYFTTLIFTAGTFKTFVMSASGTGMSSKVNWALGIKTMRAAEV